MNVLKAARIWLGYHKAHSKKNTVRAYEGVWGLTMVTNNNNNKRGSK